MNLSEASANSCVWCSISTASSSRRHHNNRDTILFAIEYDLVVATSMVKVSVPFPLSTEAVTRQG